MSRAAIALGAVVGVAIWWWWDQQDAQAAQNAADGGASWTDAAASAASGVWGGFLSLVGADMDPSNLQNQNVIAFLQMIRYGESSNGDDAYRMIVGGGSFTDFTDHPRIFKTIGKSRTSAAGAYQITATTWDDLRSRYGSLLPDFSPASQDMAAVLLLRQRGALNDVKAGRFEQAIAKCRNEWTSLPGASEQLYSMAKARQILASYGGQFSGTVYA